MTKAEARRAAAARRKAARAAPGAGAAEAAAQARLREALAPWSGRPLAGYVPIRTEIDPLPAMAAWDGPVCVPVVRGEGLPLAFSLWTSGCEMVDGPFGAAVPAAAVPVVPEVLVVPLLAFDARGRRLGYGGGYYDRTLAALRAGGRALAVGFAWSAQEAAGGFPVEPTDEPLDAVATERGVRWHSGAAPG